MNPKKSPGSRPLSPLVSRVLKTAGVVITLAALLDIVILSFPYQPLERQWQIDAVTALVDRGVVPLVGLALFLTGFWVDSNAGIAIERKQMAQDPRFWACLLASLLGLAYVLVFPLHLNNVRLEHQNAMEQVSQQVANAETELSTRLQGEIASQRQQINQLVSASDEQISQLQDSGQLTAEQAALVRRFKSDPNTIEPFLQQREQELQTQAQTEIAVRKQEIESSTKTEALKSGLRVGIGSLLLAIGFITMGWLGLRNLRQV